MIRPTVLCDADGVLLNFTQSYLDALEEITGERHTPDEVTEWDFDLCPFFVELEKRYPDLKQSIHERIESPGFCLGIDPLPGAVDGLAALREVANVFVVTSPWHSSENWIPERIRSLHKHFKVRSNRVVHTSSKHLVYGAMLIDDKIGNLTNWPHGKAVLWNAHHNHDVYTDGTPIVRAYDWPSLVTMAGRLA